MHICRHVCDLFDVVASAMTVLRMVSDRVMVRCVLGCCYSVKCGGFMGVYWDLLRFIFESQ